MAAYWNGWKQIFWFLGRLFSLQDSSLRRNAPIADGRINEKPLLGVEGNSDLSLILHTSFGLDHFPVRVVCSSTLIPCLSFVLFGGRVFLLIQNYLLRWDANTISCVEDRLEAQLSTVRKQKATLQKRSAICRRFSSKLALQDAKDIFHPEFLSVCTEKGFRPSAFMQIMDTVHEDCAICFPLFNDEFAEALIRHSEDFIAFSASNGLLNDLGKERPMILDLMKLEWLNDFLLNQVMNPIARLLFHDQLNGGDLDWRHGYIVPYAASRDELLTDEMKGLSRSRLVQHTDDSELTLNVCLGREFEGGEVILSGMRGDERREGTVYSPRRGWALMHLGRQLHEVRQVTSGQRFALIVWARSLSAVRGRICPCCWMNNRDPIKYSCICSARWN